MFPTIRSRYPVYVWPNELPIVGSENETFRAIKKIEAFLSECSFPILLFTARPGGIIRQERITWFSNTVTDLTIKDIGNGIHFVQEDNPSAIAEGIVEWARDKGIV